VVLLFSSVLVFSHEDSYEAVVIAGVVIGLTLNSEYRYFFFIYQQKNEWVFIDSLKQERV
jgi:hypothetical protein